MKWFTGKEVSKENACCQVQLLNLVFRAHKGGRGEPTLYAVLCPLHT